MDPASSGFGDIADYSSDLIERAVTAGASGHMLTNINAWSPDGEWLVYDDRNDDQVFSGTRIARVHVRTGESQLLYISRHGANCGVATYSPVAPELVFMQGPDHPTPEWCYDVTHRSGWLLDARHPAALRRLDAMNYGYRFTRGALRGGSHLHVFSPDGAWVSFTYDDAMVPSAAAATAGAHHSHRNVGVAAPAGPVLVAPDHPRNHGGEFFSVLVTRTTCQPRPGTDEISRAFEEGWIGRNGYRRADGTQQQRAIAFQGMVTAADGRRFAEVFVADLPFDLTMPGDGPLEGTALEAPAPPRGTVQRRLTFTAERPFPGVASSPRHWLRSSPDGAHIVFLLRDDRGIGQLWSVSPTGGEPRQISRHPRGVASAFTWSPNGRWIAHVMDHSVCLTEAATGRAVRLTRRTNVDDPLAGACVFSPAGDKIAFMRRVTQEHGGRFLQIYVTDVPELNR